MIRCKLVSRTRPAIGGKWIPFTAAQVKARKLSWAAKIVCVVTPLALSGGAIIGIARIPHWHGDLGSGVAGTCGSNLATICGVGWAQTIVAVPEPSSAALLLVGLMIGLIVRGKHGTK